MLLVLVTTQLCCGVLNVLLLAPTWMQMVHLFLADAVWLTLVLFVAAVSAREAAISDGAAHVALAP